MMFCVEMLCRLADKNQHTFSIFGPENRESMFLGNVDIHLQVRMVQQHRKTTYITSLYLILMCSQRSTPLGGSST